MGRTPPRAREVLALALSASIALAFPTAGASGKKPPWAGQGGGPHGGGPPSLSGGQGHRHGGGGPKHHGDSGAPGRAAGGSTAPTAAASDGGGQAAPGNGHGKDHGNGNGHGHGNGNGNGNGNGHNRKATRQTSTPTPQPPTQTQGGGASAAGVTPPATTPVAPSTPNASGGTSSPHARRVRARHSHSRTPHAGRRGPGTGNARRSGTTARKPTAAAAGPPAQRSAAPTAARTSTGGRRRGHPHHDTSGGVGPAVVRTLEHVVKVIPTFIKAVVVVLAFLLVVAALAWCALARTARYLRRQRRMLLGEVGVLQGALLPNVPAELSRLEASVAYRPAAGLAAGGDFYDAFPLGGGRVGIVVGDVAGHGRDALMHTALLRYTLRAYLEADLEPRAAVQVAGRVLDRGFDTLATVVLAVYDPERHVLRYASAGHPPPVFLGPADHDPVTRASSPPIGAGLPTGLRQTTVSLPAGSAVCFFTDGLIEAHRGDDLIGRLGLVEIIRELGPHATASAVLDRVAAEADRVTDDMAACMFRVSDGPATAGAPRIEELEVRRGERLEATLGRFLTACGVSRAAVDGIVADANRVAEHSRAAAVRVAIADGNHIVEVLPANVESLAGIEARRAAG